MLKCVRLHSKRFMQIHKTQMQSITLQTGYRVPLSALYTASRIRAYLRLATVSVFPTLTLKKCLQVDYENHRLSYLAPFFNLQEITIDICIV